MDRKGLVGLAKFGVVVCFVAAVLIFSGMTFVSVISINSTSQNFTVTNQSFQFNWTSTLLHVFNSTLNSNGNTIIVFVDNTSTTLWSSYYQNASGFYDSGSYGNITGRSSYCFTSGGNVGMKFAASDYFTGNYSSGFINSTNPTNFTLLPYLICPPGLWEGNFSVRNITNGTEEYANVGAKIVIPISTQNTLNDTTKTAFFKGKIKPNTDFNNSYHYYYLNTSDITNSTGMTINISGLQKDFILELMYANGTVATESMIRGAASQEVVLSYLDVSEAWQIRLYSNFSSGTVDNGAYSGNVYFSPLNITNTDYTKVNSSIDFGALTSPNSTTPGQLFGLIITGTQSQKNVNQSAVLYKVDQWNNQNLTGQFNLLVPNYTQKLVLKVEWGYPVSEGVTMSPNVTRWSVWLRDNNGIHIGNSSDRFDIVNTTTNILNGTRTEYVSFDGPFNLSNQGFWNITVINMTNTSTQSGNWLSNYNLTAYMFLNASDWIRTNYTNGTTFNASGSNNLTVNVTLALPEWNLLNGTYSGYLEHSNGSGWKSRITLSFGVYAGVLLINNSLFNTTWKINENIGFNRTLQYNISLNNTGSFPIYFDTATNSSGFMYNGGYVVNFSLDNTGNMNAFINESKNTTINITVSINRSFTQNQPGLYYGWILYNTTSNTNTSRRSYPYGTFNLTLLFNLTSDLIVNVSQTWPVTVNTSNSTTNMSIRILNNLSLVNGTIISTTS